MPLAHIQFVTSDVCVKLSNNIHCLKIFIQTERALEAVECSQEMVHAVLLEALQWSLGKRDGITFDVFVVLYAEAWYWSVVGGRGEGERGRGLVDRTSSYLRGGLQKLTGAFTETSPAALAPIIAHVTEF